MMEIGCKLIFAQMLSITVIFPCLNQGQLFAQSCLTLFDSMDCSLPSSSICGILQARIVEWVAILFLQGIFPTQELNPGLPHCRQMLYRLSHQGSSLELAPKSLINKEKRMEFCWVMAERKRPHGGLRIPKEFFFFCCLVYYS